MQKFKYSVYAGGIEINDNYLNESTAFELAEVFSDSGYDDIFIAVENILNGATTWLKFEDK